MIKRLSVIITLAAFLMTISMITGCKREENSVGNDNNADLEQEIIQLYYQWGRLSQEHQYSGMLSLVYPGSNFEGRSNTCKQQWNDGLEMYYTFNSVKILYWESDGIPFVVGNITLHQGPSAPTFYNGFASSCRKQGDKWKLDGVNSNNDPDWWR